MCTVKSAREVMVCEVSRDQVRETLTARLGPAISFQTVDGEGTRFECADPALTAEFQASVRDALGWAQDGDGFAQLPG